MVKLNILYIIINIHTTHCNLSGLHLLSRAKKKKIPTGYNDEPGAEPIHFTSLIVSIKAQIPNVVWNYILK